jgi:hypothetical protein
MSVCHPAQLDALRGWWRDERFDRCRREATPPALGPSLGLSDEL